MDQCHERQCERCKTVKPTSEFYQKQGRAEEGPRWEKICKSCKRLDRKKRYESSKSSEGSVDVPVVQTTPQPQPKRIIEPETEPQKEPDRIIEPPNSVIARSIAATDFSLWERLYGRKITEEEKIEIVTRLGGFFKLLISEDRKAKSGNGKPSK